MIVGMNDNLPPITDEDDYSDDTFLAELVEEVIVVEEEIIVEEIAPVEDIVPVTVEKKKPAKVEVKKNTFSAQTPPPTTPHVVSANETDNVFLSQCVYKSKVSHKSLTVHHLQRRLKEWGFKSAYTDKDGYYGDKTKKSVAEFQEFVGLEVTGLMDAETFTKIFEGDTNVTVVLS
jgi:peptidoglycan hydrolase-like protein with peptidoglycan-binding domain